MDVSLRVSRCADLLEGLEQHGDEGGCFVGATRRRDASRIRSQKPPALCAVGASRRLPGSPGSLAAYRYRSNSRSTCRDAAPLQNCPYMRRRAASYWFQITRSTASQSGSSRLRCVVSSSVQVRSAERGLFAWSRGGEGSRLRCFVSPGLRKPAPPKADE